MYLQLNFERLNMASKSSESLPFVTLFSSGEVASKHLKWIICVDISGSTEQKMYTSEKFSTSPNILDVEVEFAKNFIRQLGLSEEITDSRAREDGGERFSEPTDSRAREDGGERFSEPTDSRAREDGGERFSEPTDSRAREDGGERFSEPTDSRAREDGGERFSEPTDSRAREDGSERFSEPPDDIPVIMWNAYAKLLNTSQLHTLKPDGGTQPACIFETPELIKSINNVDAMLLLTDGAIDQSCVADFGKAMIEYGLHLKTVVGVLVGNQNTVSVTASSKVNPADINISVLIPAMLSDSCILYHDNDKTYVMWTTGAFRTTWNPIDIDENTKWSDMTCVGSNETTDIGDVVISCSDPYYVASLYNSGYIPFGQNTFFNSSELLSSTPSLEELQAYPFNRICQYFKVTDRYQLLIEWFNEQKIRLMRQLLVDTKEEAIYDSLSEKMTYVPSLRRHIVLSKDSMIDYIKSRNCAVARRYLTTDEDIECVIKDLISDPHTVQVMMFFHDMMQIMKEDIRIAKETPCMSYTSHSTSPSRYSTYAGTRSDKSKPKNITKTNYRFSATFKEPHLWKKQFSRVCQSNQNNQSNQTSSFECAICCDKQNDIPFILLRKMIDDTNFDAVVDSPNEYIYNGLLCSKCADYFCHLGRDPVKSPCIAALPIVMLSNASTNIIIRDQYFEQFSKFTNRPFDHPIDPKQAKETECQNLIVTLIVSLGDIIEQYMKSSVDTATIVHNYIDSVITSIHMHAS